MDVQMDFDWIYILSQVLTVVEYGLLGLSYLAKSRLMVVILDIVSMLTGIIVYVLLGADLGMAMSIVIFVANFYYLWDEKQQKGRKKQYFVRDYIVLAVVLLLILVLTIVTYDGPLSLLSVAATTIYEISIWQKSTMWYKFLGIPVAFCWMTYNGSVGSIFGVLCELVMFATSVVGFGIELTHYKSKKAKGKKKAHV